MQRRQTVNGALQDLLNKEDARQNESKLLQMDEQKLAAIEKGKDAIPYYSMVLASDPLWSAVPATRLAGHPCHITTLSYGMLNSVKWWEYCKIWLGNDILRRECEEGTERTKNTLIQNDEI